MATAILGGCTGMPSGDLDPVSATTVPTSEYDAVAVEATPHPGLESLPWTLEGMSTDGRTLYLTVGIAGGCRVIGTQLAVEQATTYVRITSAIAEDNEGNCAAMLQTRDVQIQLTKPLGSRRLIHAPMGTIDS
ncbi:hypothetical protein KMZ32_16785 [Phycicoccus sp. MAQZ13P-2]|uniref:hypothetical protein n=1 Tax=Phycicoccus mangrovi TaxID=2840470 RepID=UPI001C005166|nr:hypothetical protein [Phycicoccus mangrovi]MBT9257390.1 hypothetical protein [Phycicoccus mangrovi]MBT9275735.1 hypothetical protein [Phycicoccus mangrovi]